MSADWESRRLDAVDAAWREIAQAPYRSAIVEHLRQHIPSLASAVDMNSGDRPQLEVIGADLRGAGFSDWADLIERRAWCEFSVTPMEVAVDLLFGEAAGLHFITEPGAARSAESHKVLQLYGDAWRAYAVASASAIADGTAQTRPDLVSFLESTADAFAQSGEDGVTIRGRDAQQIVEAYRKNPRLSESWQELPGSEGLWVEHNLEFDVLRRSDPVEFVRLADRLPHPEPVRHVMRQASETATWEELLSLLQIAPPAFRLDGSWVKEAKTPFVLTTCLIDRLAELAGEQKDSAADILSKWTVRIEQLLHLLSARPDFAFFGYALLQRLIEAGGFRPKRRQPDAEPLARAYLDLLYKLATALPVRPALGTWVSEEGDVWRHNRAVAAIAGSTLGKQEADKNALPLIEAYLGDPTLTAIGLDRALEKPTNPERFLIGQAIAQFSSPVDWLSAAWENLMPARDRARHRWALPDTKPYAADRVLLSWALCGLGCIDPTAPVSRPFWGQIHSRLNEAALTSVGSGTAVDWRIQYRFLAGLLANRFAAGPHPQALAAGRDLVKPHLCVDQKLFDILEMLHRCGMPLADILTLTPDPAEMVSLLRQIDAEQRELRRLRATMGQRQPDDLTIETLANDLEAALGAAGGSGEPD